MVYAKNVRKYNKNWNIIPTSLLYTLMPNHIIHYQRLFLENRNATTRSKMKLLLRSLSHDWQATPSFSSNSAGSSGALTSASLLSSSLSGNGLEEFHSNGFSSNIKHV